MVLRGRWVVERKTLTPEDLKHTILQFGNTRVTVFPTVCEDGSLEWNGIVTMPGLSLVRVDSKASREEALETTLAALEIFISELLGLTKTIMNLTKRLRGSNDGNK